MPKVNPIAIAVICVLGAVIVTLALLPLMTKPSSYTPPPKRGSWAPPFNPGNLPALKPPLKRVCLPGTLGYNGLVTCYNQNDCTACLDDKTLECVTVNNTKNQLVDPTTNLLDPPAPIHLYRKANGECSGRGVKKMCDEPNAPYNCKDFFCDCGTEYTHANNDPTNCDVQVLSVTEPGSYCLPAYVNACNPYTSDTVLSDVGTGPQWVCECKYNNPQIFQQNAEGTDCSVPIACGAQEPQFVKDKVVKVMKYKSTDSSCTNLMIGGVPAPDNDWKLCDSYPNQLVSSNPGSTSACTVPTDQTTTAIDTKLSYVAYQPSLIADPTCIIQPFTNVCTVQTAFDKNNQVIATQVLRGSGSANDPKLSRVWPPFPDILPIGMQACPDNWSGKGTVQDPCNDGVSPTPFTFSYLDSNGQWNGKYLSLQDLRNEGYTGGTSATICGTDSDCKSPQFCSGAGVCVTSCDPSDPSKACSDASPCISGDFKGDFCSHINDDSCRLPGNSVLPVGLSGTLGALKWKTVNSGCVSPPLCIESSTSLQSIKRAWDTPKNLFPVTSDNIGSSTCSNLKAPICECPSTILAQTCTDDNGCKTGNVCNIVPIFAKSCTADSECHSNHCNGGQCSVACNTGDDCDQTTNKQFCSNAKMCSTGFCGCDVQGSNYTCNNPEDSELCSAVNGFQQNAYDGALDGPVDDVDGASLGAACSCQGFSFDDMGQKVPLIPGAYIDSSLNWTCVPDPCFIPGANSYYDNTRKQCECGMDSHGSTYYSWNTNDGVPSCQRDPCNPIGSTSPIQVVCKTDDDCFIDKVECTNNLCYVWTDLPCKIDTAGTDCAEGVSGGQSVECLLKESDQQYYCAVQDSTRPTCEQASECSLGICNKTTKLCTGGCVCSGNSAAYFTDANPLHSACTNTCVFNPCGSNGTCQSDKQDSSYTCICNAGFYGTSCENRICLGPGSYCDSSNPSQCCSNVCNYKFLVGDTCDHLA